MKPIQISIIIFILFFSQFCFSQSKIPDISIKSSTGEIVNIKEFTKNKTVILSFWATWCVPCINELNNINEVYENWQNETDIILLAVSIDDSRTLSRVLPLANSNDWNYEILFDKNQELKRAFNILNIPYQIAIHNGNIFYSHTGYVDGQENILIEKIKEHLKID